MSSIVPSQNIQSSATQHSAHHFIRMSAHLRDVEHYLGRSMSMCFHAVFFILLIRFFVGEPGVTDGISMEPTMHDNTAFAVEKISPLIVPPQRFDIVQFFKPTDKKSALVKRVIGLPGETVAIKQNAVYITPPNGQEYKLPEPYLRPDVIVSVPYGTARTFVVRTNEYFVLGDNRQYSSDSREFGAVSRSLITGKVFPLMLQ